MRKFLYLTGVFVLFTAVFIGLWIVIFEVMNHFGFNDQATPFYGFTSGPGPMVLTAMLGATVVTGMWHSLNCHEETCWRIGKHKVSGTPYCSKHQASARPHASAEELLMTIVHQLEDLMDFLGVGSSEPEEEETGEAPSPGPGSDLVGAGS